MALEDAKRQVDLAFTRPELKGLAFENTFAGATSFLRRRYTKDLAGEGLLPPHVPPRVEPAGVAVRPLRGHVVGGVGLEKGHAKSGI